MKYQISNREVNFDQNSCEKVLGSGLFPLSRDEVQRLYLRGLMTEQKIDNLPSDELTDVMSRVRTNAKRKVLQLDDNKGFASTVVLMVMGALTILTFLFLGIENILGL